MAWASWVGAVGCALLALVSGSSSVDFGAPPSSFYPRFNPFFFLCTHHGELEGAGVTEGGGEVLLSLQITGSPSVYTPGQEYQGEQPRKIPLFLLCMLHFHIFSFQFKVKLALNNKNVYLCVCVGWEGGCLIYTCAQ